MSIWCTHRCRNEASKQAHAVTSSSNRYKFECMRIYFLSISQSLTSCNDRGNMDERERGKTCIIHVVMCAAADPCNRDCRPANWLLWNIHRIGTYQFFPLTVFVNLFIIIVIVVVYINIYTYTCIRSLLVSNHCFQVFYRRIAYKVHTHWVNILCMPPIALFHYINDTHTHIRVHDNNDNDIDNTSHFRLNTNDLSFIK